jgi:hypothetical protein
MDMSFDSVPATELVNDDYDPGGEHTCVVCGTPTYRTSNKGRWPIYCDDHKTAASRNGHSSSGSATAGADKKRRKGKKHGAAKEDDWNKFFIILLLGGTYAVGRFAAGGQGLMLEPPKGVSEEQLTALAEYLAMSEDEVVPIANYLAPMLVPTGFNKKYGYVITQAVELEEIGAALWQYGKRITPALAERIKHNGAQAAQHERERQGGLAQRLFQERVQTNGSTGPHQESHQQGPNVRDIVAANNERQRRSAPPDIEDN